MSLHLKYNGIQKNTKLVLHFCKRSHNCGNARLHALEAIIGVDAFAQQHQVQSVHAHREKQRVEE